MTSLRNHIGILPVFLEFVPQELSIVSDGRDLRTGEPISMSLILKMPGVHRLTGICPSFPSSDGSKAVEWWIEIWPQEDASLLIEHRVISEAMINDIWNLWGKHLDKPWFEIVRDADGAKIIRAHFAPPRTPPAAACSTPSVPEGARMEGEGETPRVLVVELPHPPPVLRPEIADSEPPTPRQVQPKQREEFRNPNSPLISATTACSPLGVPFEGSSSSVSSPPQLSPTPLTSSEESILRQYRRGKETRAPQRPRIAPTQRVDVLPAPPQTPQRPRIAPTQRVDVLPAPSPQTRPYPSPGVSRCRQDFWPPTACQTSSSSSSDGDECCSGLSLRACVSLWRKIRTAVSDRVEIYHQVKHRQLRAGTWGRDLRGFEIEYFRQVKNRRQWRKTERQEYREFGTLRWSKLLGRVLT